MTVDLTEKEIEKLLKLLKIQKHRFEFSQDYGTSKVLRDIIEKLEKNENGSNCIH